VRERERDVCNTAVAVLSVSVFSSRASRCLPSPPFIPPFLPLSLPPSTPLSLSHSHSLSPLSPHSLPPAGVFFITFADKDETERQCSVSLLTAHEDEMYVAECQGLLTSHDLERQQ
jgi:hypothetical protein